MVAGLESVSLLAMTSLRHLLNVSQFAGFSVSISDGRVVTHVIRMSQNDPHCYKPSASWRLIRRRLDGYSINARWSRSKLRERVVDLHLHVLTPFSKGISPGLPS